MDRRPRKNGNGNVRRNSVPQPNRPSMNKQKSANIRAKSQRKVPSAPQSPLRASLHNIGLHIFYARERILCGVVCTLLMVFFVLLQTTVFSAVRPFGAIPDLMISFTAALAVTEGRKWGAVFGIIAAVVIEALSVNDVTLLPLIYMPIGFFCGVFCKYYFTGSFPVRTIITFATLPLRAIVTAAYAYFSPISITSAEIFYDIVLPETAATLFFALPVHLLMYVCLRPFHRTRAEKVSEL